MGGRVQTYTPEGLGCLCARVPQPTKVVFIREMEISSLRRLNLNEDSPKTPKNTSMNSSVRLSRSSSLKLSSSTNKSSVKLMGNVHASESSKVTTQNLHPSKKVTFKPNLETDKSTHDSKEKKTVPSIQRSTSLPRYMVYLNLSEIDISASI